MTIILLGNLNKLYNEHNYIQSIYEGRLEYYIYINLS